MLMSSRVCFFFFSYIYLFFKILKSLILTCVPQKNMERFTNLRVILAQGHANLLCIVPILVYVLPKRALMLLFIHGFYIATLMNSLISSNVL